MFYVIGSGPAGVSCAYALLERGQEVTMLDVGNDLGPTMAANLQMLGTQQPQEWDPRIISEIKDPMRPQSSGLPVKYCYGSDYPYAGVSDRVKMEQHDTACVISHAKGGLSTVWGAAVLPYVQEDIGSWPLSAAELAPYYKQVLKFMPLSGVQDSLSAKFPLFTDAPQQLQPSSQARMLLEHMAKHEHKLHEHGIMFGRARVAVQGKRCNYCTMCAYGCPYQLIYNAAYTVQELQKNPRFHYISGVFVERVEEKGETVRIYAATQNGKTTYDAQRVFLGCGAVSTANIMLQSLNLQSLIIKDTQYFLLPMMHLRGATGIHKEQLHTLPQLFLELSDKKMSEHTVHIQVYTYSDLYAKALEHKFGPAYSVLKYPLAKVLERLAIAMVFLHSEDSHEIKMRRENGKTVLERIPHKNTKRIIRHVVQKLRKNRGELGIIPVSPMMEVAPAGKSFHLGGSFPMSRNPGPQESDLLGRPAGLRRVHIVDASVFPTLPATTITFSIMANAYRIGAQWDREA